MGDLAGKIRGAVDRIDDPGTVAEGTPAFLAKDVILGKGFAQAGLDELLDGEVGFGAVILVAL